MADITHDDILKLARLSRLHIEPDEADQFAKEISVIIRYVEQLQSVDVKNVEPTYQVTGLTNVTRADEVSSYGASSEELINCAPATEKNQLKVKRMIA